MDMQGSVFGAEEARTTIATNVVGTMRVTHALLPALKRKRGRIINVCSQAGKQRIIRSDALRKRFQEAQSEDEARGEWLG
jgi:NADP-dependent 3-hydroxy acid dehydrogenase YdfG